MTLLGQEDAIDREAARAHPEMFVREKIYGHDEKFTANLGQKKCAVTAFFEPVGIALHELFDLGLCKRQLVGFHLETTEHFLKGTVSYDFVDLHQNFFGWRPGDIAAPMLKIGINVSERPPARRQAFPDHRSD